MTQTLKYAERFRRDHNIIQKILKLITKFVPITI
jgi:hypothetical protein